MRPCKLVPVNFEMRLIVTRFRQGLLREQLFWNEIVFTVTRSRSVQNFSDILLDRIAPRHIITYIFFVVGNLQSVRERDGTSWFCTEVLTFEHDHADLL